MPDFAQSWTFVHGQFSEFPGSFWLVLSFSALAIAAILAAIYAFDRLDEARDRNDALSAERDQALEELEHWKSLHDRAHAGWASANEVNRRMLSEPYRFGLGLVRDLQRIANDETEAN